MIDITTILAEHEALQAKVTTVLDQLKDTALPLDVRWAAYTALVKNNLLVSEDPYGDGMLEAFVNGDQMTMYDTFNVDRHQSIDYVVMYQKILDADPRWDETLVAAREAGLSKWQEAVLASGHSSMTYDW